jgi:hypothetical protein
MRKQDVFVVTGRNLLNGVPRGSIVTMVVCAAGEQRVIKVLKENMPGFGVTTTTSLAALEDRAKDIRDVVAGKKADWSVLVDPLLERAA